MLACTSYETIGLTPVQRNVEVRIKVYREVRMPDRTIPPRCHVAEGGMLMNVANGKALGQRSLAFRSGGKYAKVRPTKTVHCGVVCHRG